jgi:hypothetical protein
VYFLLWQKLRERAVPPAGGEAPAGDAGQGAPTAAPPLVRRSSDAAGGRVILLVVLGLEKDAIERIIDDVTASRRAGAPEPLFLTDLDRFELFRARDLAFEHIPSARSKSLIRGDLPWETYLRRRLDLMMSKWQPVATIPYGEVAGGIVKAWRGARV